MYYKFQNYSTMNILAVDTANSYCSVAIIGNCKVLDSKIIKEENKQAEILIPTIEKLLSENSLSYNDFDAFVVTVGPGSFIGVRIGIAAMQGIALTVKKPLYGVSTLEVVAFILSHNNLESKNITAILNAGRDRIYFQNFSADLVALSEPKIFNIDNIFCANGSLGGNCNLYGSLNIAHDALNAGLLALKKIRKNMESSMGIEVIYVR